MRDENSIFYVILLRVWFRKKNLLHDLHRNQRNVGGFL